MLFSKKGFRFDQREDFKGVIPNEKRGAQAFLDNNPEWAEYHSEKNISLLRAYLYVHNDAPYTRLNFELAFDDIKDQLTPNPPEAVPANDRGIIQVVEDVQATWQPDTDERKAIAACADDVHISDHARRARDHKLRLLADEQRRGMSRLPGSPSRAYPDGSDPKIQI